MNLKYQINRYFDILSYLMRFQMSVQFFYIFKLFRTLATFECIVIVIKSIMLFNLVIPEMAISFVLCCTNITDIGQRIFVFCFSAFSRNLMYFTSLFFFNHIVLNWQGEELHLQNKCISCLWCRICNQSQLIREINHSVLIFTKIVQGFL